MKNIKISLLVLFISGMVMAQKSTINVEYMDSEVKATEDFFLFSNGNWIKKNEIPASESRWGSFNELDQSNKEKITKILLQCEKEALKSPNGSDKQLLGDFYHSFLDMNSRNEKGYSQIEQDLKKIHGITNKTELADWTAHLHNQGVGSLFGIYVGQDMKDIETNQYHIYQSGIGLPNMEYYSSENKKDILIEYQKYISKSHRTIYKNDRESEQFAENIIKFESALASKMFRPAEMRIPENTYNKKTRAEITAMLHPFELDVYIDGRALSRFDNCIVGTLKYIENIPNMMSDFKFSISIALL